MKTFERNRERYLDDAAYSHLQECLLSDPEVGVLIKSAGGLRKLRFRDARRGQGKRGGLRVIYYYWTDKAEFWLFTVYDKDELDDLAPRQREALREQLKAELRWKGLN
jgi:hypothetical protein